MCCVSTVVFVRRVGVLSVRLAELARHRRPLVDGPPPELLEFRGDDWMPLIGGAAFEAWLRARFEWARTHPDDFSLGGDALDLLRDRVGYRRELLPGSVLR